MVSLVQGWLGELVFACNAFDIQMAQCAEGQLKGAFN
jgi:hypothetical protein